MDQLHNFTDAPFGYKTYGGSDTKTSIIYKDEAYMLKAPQRLTNTTNLQSSFANNVISEYIGSRIMQSLGIPTQETLLGERAGELVVACKDFCPPGSILAEFAAFMRETYRPQEIGRFPTYKQLYDIFELNKNIAHLKDKTISHYWDEFVGDALIGNFDRHKGNFGYLVNQETKEISVSPVYDCGSSLYPNLSENQMQRVLSSSEEIEMRIYKFPLAALNKNSNPRKEQKLGYFEALSGEFYDQNCIEAFHRIYKKVDLNAIKHIIDETPVISDNRKAFYKTMIQARKEMILDRAYEICLNKGLIKLDDSKPDGKTNISRSRKVSVRR